MKYPWMIMCLAFALSAAADNSASATDALDKSKPNWWIAQLTKVASLRSTKQRPPHDVTVALAGSLDRFEALELLCRHSWSGTIAAAIYLPLWKGRVHMPNVSTPYHDKALPEALSNLEGFYERMQHPTHTSGGCALDMDVYAENMAELSDWFTYPVNSMRNRALALVKTEAVVLLDADFVIGPPSWGRALVHNQTTYDTLLKLLQRKAALVLPALRDIDNPEYVPTEDSKAFISDVVQHTDYDRWCNATRSYYVPYGYKGRQPDGSPAFEPYIVTLKHGLPSYDERFRGFFKNKITFLWYLHVLGYQFHVDPEAFVIHYPHIKQNIPQQMHSAKHHELMRIWSEEMPAAMANGTYKPVIGRVAPPTKRARARRKLPQD